MVVEVPSSRKFSVSDIRIAGEPIRYGGQIAECITVKLVGLANILPTPINRPAVRTSAGSGIDPFNPRTIDGDIGLGRIEAFLNQGTGDVPVAVQVAAPAKPMKAAFQLRPSALRRHRSH